MNDIIKLKSRNRTQNYLKVISKLDGSESKTYILKTDSPNLRIGYLSSGYTFIYPSRGPKIKVGKRLEEADAVVKSIDFIKGYGWTITFK